MYIGRYIYQYISMEVLILLVPYTCSEKNNFHLYLAFFVSIAGKNNSLVKRTVFFRNMRSLWNNNSDHK